VLDILLQYPENDTIVITWDNTGWSYLGTFILQDAFDGQLGIDIDMTTINSLTLTNPAFTTLKLKVTAGEQQASPVHVDFYPDVYSGNIPLEVQFYDESTSDNGEIIAWEWGFGDGDTSTNQNPTHTYETAGTYTVSLTVTDEVGISNISTIVDLLSACDSGYVGIYNGCYWEEDIVFLQELIDNSGLDIEALALGEQEWEDGRLTILNCDVCGLSGELPESIGNPTNL
ncbi:uncharacterized protein METZ01_LOCUS516319, partial [marine metagenome]